MLQVRLQGELMKAKDARVARTAEALAAIKLIKASAWEHCFGGRIQAARGSEVRVLWRSVALSMFFGVLWEAVPLLVGLVSELIGLLAATLLSLEKV